MIDLLKCSLYGRDRSHYNLSERASQLNLRYKINTNKNGGTYSYFAEIGTGIRFTHRMFNLGSVTINPSRFASLHDAIAITAELLGSDIDLLNAPIMQLDFAVDYNEDYNSVFGKAFFNTRNGKVSYCDISKAQTATAYYKKDNGYKIYDKSTQLRIAGSQRPEIIVPNTPITRIERTMTYKGDTRPKLSELEGYLGRIVSGEMNPFEDVSFKEVEFKNEADANTREIKAVSELKAYQRMKGFTGMWRYMGRNNKRNETYLNSGLVTVRDMPYSMLSDLQTNLILQAPDWFNESEFEPARSRPIPDNRPSYRYYDTTLDLAA